MRQAANFAGDHGKAAPLFASAGRFDCSIERQDIGLESDTVNHRNDVDDFVGRGADRGHGRDHRSHLATATASYIGSSLCQLISLIDMDRTVFDRVGNLRHDAGGFAQGIRLLVGTFRLGVIVTDNFLRRGSDGAGAVADVDDGVAQGNAHLLQGFAGTTGRHCILGQQGDGAIFGAGHRIDPCAQFPGLDRVAIQ